MARRELSEQAFFVLSALAEQPLHGYAIIREVGGLSDGRLALRVGTLYGILDRLAGDGMIELDREEIVDSRLRRYYRITSDGQHLLTREATQLAARARMAQDRLARGRSARITPAGGTA